MMPMPRALVLRHTATPLRPAPVTKRRVPLRRHVRRSTWAMLHLVARVLRRANAYKTKRAALPAMQAYARYRRIILSPMGKGPTASWERLVSLPVFRTATVAVAVVAAHRLQRLQRIAGRMRDLFVALVAFALRRPRSANLVRAIVRRAHTAAAPPVWRKMRRAPAKALATLVSVLRIAIPRRTCARPRRQTAPPAILIRNAPVAIAWVTIAASGPSRRPALVPA